MILSCINCFFCPQGIIVGLDNLDAIINIIRETSGNKVATAALGKGMSFFI